MKIALTVPQFECEEISSPLLQKKGVQLYIGRADQIDPVISGNKLFKLYYYLQEALENGQRPLCTFGGAYSNHLVATAKACNKFRLKSIGIVRGEKPASLSHSLLECIQHGMELHFVSREAYQRPGNLLQALSLPANYVLIPEGGYHPMGAKGAALMMNSLQSVHPTHICTAVGTATTLAGLLQAASPDQQIIGITVLKNMKDIQDRLQYLLNRPGSIEHVLMQDYHFGGYAKKTTSLISFMNEFYRMSNIATDFVYTAKMMFAVMDQIEKDYFPSGSRIVCIHTGGLQGNLSLQPGSLVF